MNNMLDTIAEYKQSCTQILDRIHALNAQIGGQAPATDDMQTLMRRRKMLYTELAEMQSAIQEMEEYVDAHSPAAHCVKSA